MGINPSRNCLNCCQPLGSSSSFRVWILSLWSRSPFAVNNVSKKELKTAQWFVPLLQSQHTLHFQYTITSTVDGNKKAGTYYNERSLRNSVGLLVIK